MKWNEMKWNEMKWNEMKWNEWNKIKEKKRKESKIKIHDIYYTQQHVPYVPAPPWFTSTWAPK